MSYLHLDDNFAQHPKITPLSAEAFRLHVAGLCYCARHLTDGIVPGAAIPTLTPYRYKASLVTELIGAGIWIELESNSERHTYRIHDYLDWNESRTDVFKRREKSRKAALTRWNGHRP